VSRVPASQDCFQAIADPTRRALLDRLGSGEKTAGELGEGIALSQPALSKHLRILREAGLVEVRAKGRTRVYAERPEGMHELIDWIEHHQRFWEDRLTALGTHLARKKNR